jgi:hypothetical protein
VLGWLTHLGMPEAPLKTMYRVPGREAIFLWRVNKLDFLVWVTAFIIVVFAGVEAGLASAVGLSLLIVLWKVQHPAMLVAAPAVACFGNQAQYVHRMCRGL